VVAVIVSLAIALIPPREIHQDIHEAAQKIEGMKIEVSRKSPFQSN